MVETKKSDSKGRVVIGVPGTSYVVSRVENGSITLTPIEAPTPGVRSESELIRAAQQLALDINHTLGSDHPLRTRVKEIVNQT